MKHDIPSERLDEIRLRLTDYIPFFGKRLYEQRNRKNHYFTSYYEISSRLSNYTSICAAATGMTIGTITGLCLEKLVK